MTIENFLSNTMDFNGVNDILYYITNIKSEEYSNNILDFTLPISKKSLYTYLVSKINKQSKDLKDKVALEILARAIAGLTEEQCTKVYYKNKLFDVLAFDKIKSELEWLSKREYLKEPDDEAGKAVFKETSKRLEDVRNIIIEFVFYNYILEDRFKRAIKNNRNSVIVVDTDSNFINLNPCFEFMRDNFGIDANNKVARISCVNMFTTIITEILKRAFWTLTTNFGVQEDFRQRIAMKNEFLYKRIMTTKNKKSYAGELECQEGNIFNECILDMKGMAIKKTTTNKRISAAFQDMLVNDVLLADKIDLRPLLKRFNDLEVEITKSLQAGEIDYSLPKSVSDDLSYTNPRALEQIRGKIAWNAVYPENPIRVEKVNLFKLTTGDPNSPGMQNLKETHPDIYEKIMDVVFERNVPDNLKTEVSKNGLNVICLPKSVEKVPDWIIPLIDINAMVCHNLNSGSIILESLGVHYFKDTKRKVRVKTNIVDESILCSNIVQL